MVGAKGRPEVVGVSHSEVDRMSYPPFILEFKPPPPLFSLLVRWL